MLKYYSNLEERLVVFDASVKTAKKNLKRK